MSPRNSKTHRDKKDLKHSVRIGKGRGVRYRLGHNDPQLQPSSRVPYYMELEETKAKLNLYEQQNRVLVTKISSLLVACDDAGLQKEAAGVLQPRGAKHENRQQSHPFGSHRSSIELRGTTDHRTQVQDQVVARKPRQSFTTA